MMRDFEFSDRVGLDANFVEKVYQAQGGHTFAVRSHYNKKAQASSDGRLTDAAGLPGWNTSVSWSWRAFHHGSGRINPTRLDPLGLSNAGPACAARDRKSVV
jgi:hypothetical protein